MIGSRDTWFDPSYARSSFLPIVNNQFDLGSSTLKFRTLYLSTSLNLNNNSKVKGRNFSNSTDFDLLQVDTNDYLRLGGASTQNHFYTNSLLRFFTENYNFFFNSAFSFLANTADGSDNSELALNGGGGSLDATRGGWIRISGNEHANAGSISMRSGDNANSAIILDAFGTNSFISFKNQNSHIFYVTALGLQSRASANIFYTSTSDGSDTHEQSFCGGGSSSTSRGGRFSVFGNEHGTNSGQAGITGGAVSGGHVYLTSSNSAAYIQLLLNGTKDWEFRATNQLLYTTDALIAAATSDASDNKKITITGGGAAGSSRGGAIELYGNENANTGKIIFRAGNVSGGSVLFATGGADVLELLQGGTLKIYNTTAPGTPSGGGYLYVESGALKYKGSSGTGTVIAPA